MRTKELLKSIRKHEGLSLVPYQLNTPIVHEHIYTIGYGHTLLYPPKEISLEEAEIYLRDDVIEAIQAAVKVSPELFTYHWSKQNFMIEMCFNLGYHLKSFKQANKALRQGDIPKAIKEYKDSLWAKQVGNNRVSDLMYLLKYKRYKDE
jgi:GH24 family phage-related lysozyme (muramidase)